MRMPPGVRRLFRLPDSRERLTRELDEEVRFHVEMRVARLIAQGVPYDDARAEALRRFGDVDDLRDYCQTIEDAHMQRARARERLGTVIQDSRFALRQFRKSPGFAVVAAFTLALGIGGTTAIFSVVNGVILRPLPFDRSEQLVQLFGIDSKAHRMVNFADRTFDFIADQNRSLSALAEYNSSGMSISSGTDALRLTGSAVSKQFFDVLRVRPAAGRFFVPEEQQVGAPLTVVISHGLWTRQFGASSSAIGARLMSGQTIATIVGVMPEGQELPAGTDLWYPRDIFEKDVNYTAHNWKVIGRVKDGVTLSQASSDVSTLLRRLRAQVGNATWTFDGEAVSLREQMVGQIKPLLLLILAASAVLLLIACTNVANLLIARMAVRENEIAVRLSIGAGRARLAQQLLIETSFLSAAGCLLGLVLAALGMHVLLVLRPALIPRVGELRLDWRVGAFAMGLAAATAIGLGLLAAWRAASGDLRAALSQSQRTQGGGGASYRIRGSLVVAQLAMTVVLLIGAGLLARSFARLMTLDTGFRTNGVVVATLGLESPSEERVARRTQYFDEIARRATAIPGVTNVGFSNAEPFNGGSSNGTFVTLSGTNVKLTPQDLMPLFNDKAHAGYANYQMVSGGYFKAMNIPLLSGRLMDDNDRDGAAEVAVVNATLAKKQWPNESPIGKVIEFGNIDGDLAPLTVVGVVGDTREEQLASDPPATIYVSYRQRPGNDNGMYVVMSTNAEASTIATARQTFRQVRADVPMRFQTIEDIVGRSVASQRFMLFVVGVFGAVALVLASLGVYSVISYLVAQRGREISIRVALGARATDIVRLVVRQGIQLVVIGVVVGGVAALFATRVLTQMLYGTKPTDPVTFAGMVLTLAFVALVASYLPARRASKAEPMDVLRGG
ncbi:MAG TPA: ABC transporter permease [Gemmatimonadaceae bacterium]|nr:ABC transporter permease [Gemmatimonadaceae bacterium]